MSCSRFDIVAGCLAGILGASCCARAFCGEENAPRAELSLTAGGSEPSESAVTPADPIAIEAHYATRWSDTDGTTVMLLRGRCQIVQGRRTLTSEQMVIWGNQDDAHPGGTLFVYMEGVSTLVEPGVRRVDPIQVAELKTTAKIVLSAQTADTSSADDAVFHRAAERRRAMRRVLTAVRRPVSQSSPILAAPAISDSVLPPRHVTINPRYLSQGLAISGRPTEGTTPAEYVITITQGVNIIVDNVPLQINNQLMLTRVDLTADRAVVWTDANAAQRSEFDLNENTPLQVYLEGNIIARQGTNEARASHAFYDLNNRQGLLLNAEVRTFIPELNGPLRVRADAIRQLSENNFHATNAYVTTSTFGRPGYRVEASDIFLEERFDPRSGRIDPQTGLPDVSEPWVTSVNNRFYIEEVPVFALPYLSSPARDVQIPLQKLDVGYSGVFGLKVETIFDLDTLFGLNLPPGVDLGLQADLFSARGPGVGLRGDYDVDGDLFGVPAHSTGMSRLYYLNDTGTDNLGFGRRSLEPADQNRGRALWRHRMDFSANTWLTAELGYLSDRNFLEQYDETSWDRDKDYENLVSLNHHQDNVALSGLVRGRLNDFSNQTNWLPRGDISVLGEPLLGSLLTWTSRSSVGYGQIKTAAAPGDPTDIFQPLGFVQPASGLVAMTRHELDAPFMLGPVNVVPYLLGEAAAWQEDYTGSGLSRLYGSAGVRASVQFFKALPDFYDPIFGLHGLAHKMQFDVDYYIAQSTQNLSDVPQYNEFDDDAQERFRERFVPLEYGGTLPAQFDPRFYAVRAGAGRGVTDPYFELVDDMQVVRLGWRNRLQTKEGPPDRPRIKDWMTLDLETSIFPNANRDDFGETVGLMTGRYAWHIGQRTSLLANALVDAFNDGQRIWNVGVLTQRGMRGSLYLGFRQVDVGPINSQLLTGSYSYRMSPKWISTLGASFDVAEGRDRGESLTITRVGEYLLFHAGLGFDASRNNVGIGISLEPRIGSFNSGSSQLSSLLGIPQ